MFEAFVEVFSERPLGCVILLSGVFAILFSCVGIPLVKVVTQETVVITVTGKERIGGDNSKYLVWSEGEVFENTDELIFGKFNSSDVYGELEVGRTYEVKVVGIRIPFLSWYRNIVRVNKEV